MPAILVKKNTEVENYICFEVITIINKKRQVVNKMVNIYSALAWHK